MRWLAPIAVLFAGLVAGPALFTLLLVNEPQDLGQRVIAYRLFAILASGVLSLAPIAAVATVLAHHRRRWLLASLFFLVLPGLVMAAGAAYTAFLLWR